MKLATAWYIEEDLSYTKHNWGCISAHWGSKVLYTTVCNNINCMVY